MQNRAETTWLNGKQKVLNKLQPRGKKLHFCSIDPRSTTFYLTNVLTFYLVFFFLAFRVAFHLVWCSGLATPAALPNLHTIRNKVAAQQELAKTLCQETGKKTRR